MSWLQVFFFPGMVLHELAHVLACLLTGVKIHAIKWFGTTEAFVKHDPPGAFSGLVITLAPLFLGTLVGYFSLQAAFSNNPDFLATLFFLWVSLSTLIFAFPSQQDAHNTLRAFTASYQTKILGKQPLLYRFVWLLLLPFIFIPLLLLLSILLVIDSFFLFRIAWALGFVSWVL